jgi:hypothetical protein
MFSVLHFALHSFQEGCICSSFGKFSSCRLSVSRWDHRCCSAVFRFDAIEHVDELCVMHCVDSSSLVFRQSILIMGSVDEDYECPWCGRRGAGGYSPDQIGYPICTEPPHACLDHFLDFGVDSKAEYDEAALRRRFGSKLQLPDTVWTLVCELLSADVQCRGRQMSSVSDEASSSAAPV